jgi:hypothetical protein
MRLAGVPGERRGAEHRGTQEVSRVQSGVILLQGPRRAAHVRARESVRRADSGLRLPEVQKTSRCRCHMSPVQGGDVLQQETQVETLVGAREQVRGASLIKIERDR